MASVIEFIEDFEDDLRLLDIDIIGYNDSDSEAEVGTRKQRKFNLRPFYERRKDIFKIFDDEKIYQTFRFDKESIIYIAGLIERILPCRIIKSERCLTPVDQVLLALQFYATGTFQSVVGNVLRVSQPSVCRSIHAVSLALTSIAAQHINFGNNLLTIKKDMFDIAGLPGVVGCIDGTHIRLTRPAENEYCYVNRKGFHSINVQAICDAHCRFLSVNVTKPGSVHDSAIFKDSAIGQKFADGQFGDGYLLGDSGYACTPYLLTPYSTTSSIEEERFNRAHKSTRCVIERTFGVLKRRFHCLHGELRMQPKSACKIIMACFVLHNLALERNQPGEFIDDGVEEGELIEMVGIPTVNDEGPVFQGETRLRRLGFEKRQRIAQNVFSS